MNRYFKEAYEELIGALPNYFGQRYGQESFLPQV
jgi:hypothetical protein